MFISRKRIAMVMAEFLGTAILTSIVIAVGRSQVGLPYFIALAIGLALVVIMLSLGTVSGGHFNPAVTIGMWTIRRASALKTVAYVSAQLLGATGAYLLFTYLLDRTWENVGQFEARVLVAEVVGTIIFTMGIAAAVYNKFEAGKAAFVIGASLTVGILVATVASAGLLNPAIALGVHSWVWGTYVLGPILGGVIGFNLYALLFAPESSLIAKFKPGKRAAKTE